MKKKNSDDMDCK